MIDEASRVFCIKISDDISELKCSVCLQVKGKTVKSSEVGSNVITDYCCNIVPF